MKTILLVAPNSWVVRNWIATGLADLVRERLQFEPVFVSPFENASFRSPSGAEFVNHFVPVDTGQQKPAGLSRLLFLLFYLRLRTFAVEVPLGSIQMMKLSRRRDLIHFVVSAISRLLPKCSRRRKLVRSLVDAYSPFHALSARIIQAGRPEAVVVGSPGFFFLDQVVMIEAQRAGVPVHCVVNSWDNMTSRGAMIRRPDSLMVWNDYMRDQAEGIHCYPISQVHVVGSLQFCRYEEPTTNTEETLMYQRLGLKNGSPFLLFLTGQHVPEYEAEDIAVLLKTLETSSYADTPLVVRIHPQGNREPFRRIRHPRLILDLPPEFKAGGSGGEGFDMSEIRIMAALLRKSAVVFSSWATTALLEAAIFDRPIVQLRWMDAFPRRAREEAERVKDFQKYLHLIPFDETSCRLFSASPEKLKSDLLELDRQSEILRRNRRLAVERLATVPLEDAPSRVVDVLQQYLAH